MGQEEELKLWGFARSALTRNIIVGVMLLLVAGVLLFLSLYLHEVQRNKQCSEEKIDMERLHSREKSDMQAQMSATSYTVGELRAKIEYLEKIYLHQRRNNIKQR